MHENKLEIKDLDVSVDGNKILKNINLEIKEGEIHALMGPNGSGKSTLAHVIMGNPKYTVDKGSIVFNGQDLLNLKPEERAKLGIFLAFQHPVEVSGVNVFNFLRTAYTKLHSEEIDIEEFEKVIVKKLKMLGMSEYFISRYLNDGFSGGEKKKFEVLQMLILRPKIAILDEIDSGLDVDSLKTISKLIKGLTKNTGILLITHYERILKYIKPHFVHVIIDGKIVESGNSTLVSIIEKNGYNWFRVRANE